MRRFGSIEGTRSSHSSPRSILVLHLTPPSEAVSFVKTSRPTHPSCVSSVVSKRDGAERSMRVSAFVESQEEEEEEEGSRDKTPKQ